MTLQVLNRNGPGSLLKPIVQQRRHVLDLNDFSVDEVETVMQTAAQMKDVLKRPIKKVPTLRGKTLVTLFYENSTRTRVGFEVAAKALGADTNSVSAATSSVTKGESLIDTIRTLQALGADFVVIRHHQAGAPYVVAGEVSASVINAGDGWHAHPTQALLDLFTIRERLGRIEGLRVAIVGDILHSRVARSTATVLTMLGADVTLVAPRTLLPPVVDLPFTEALDDVIGDVDVLYLLRMQQERMGEALVPSLREYTMRFGLTADRAARLAPHALVMHPGPMNRGVEITVDPAELPGAVITQQVTNGIAVRMAVLFDLLGGEGSSMSNEKVTT